VRHGVKHCDGTDIVFLGLGLLEDDMMFLFLFEERTRRTD
jgi:hypothetical protein